jgi:hypothetical protein
MAHATSRHGAERLFRHELTQTMLGAIQGTLAEMDPQKKQARSIDHVDLVTLAFP